MLRNRRLSKDSTYWILAQVTIISAGIAFRWPSMSYALTEAHAFRQTQTTIMIREFMERGFWQVSPLPVFGPPWQAPMEFPLFQWMAAVAGHVVGTTPQIAGRATALILFEMSALLSAHLASRWFSRRTGIVVLLLFQFIPFAYQWGNAPLIEFLPVVGALTGLLCADHWIRRPRLLWIIGGTLAMSVAFLVKPTTAIAWLPAYVAVAIDWSAGRRVRRQLHRWPLVLAPVVGVLFAITWTAYADNFKAAHFYTHFLTSGNLSAWNFGTLDQRLNADQWRVLFSYSEAIYGSFVVFPILLVASLITWKRVSVIVALALVMPMGALTFFNLYYMHNYYQCAVLPALVIIVAAGISGLANLTNQRSAHWAVVTVAMASVLLLSWTSGEGVLISKRQVGGLYTFPLASEIAEYVPSDQGVILLGCDWDPSTLYLSGRRGLMIRPDAEGFPVPSDWVGKDLTYVAFCGQPRDVTRLLPFGTHLDQVSGSVFRIRRS